MTLAEAGEIFDYWAQNPPAHLMVQVIARMLGWKSPAGDSRQVSSDAADPASLLLTGVFGPASPDLASEFAELAGLAARKG